MCVMMLSMTTQTIKKTASLEDTLVTNIRVALAMKKMSQNALAKQMGITGGALSQKMRGTVTWTLQDLEKAGQLLGVEPAVLLDPHGLLVAGHGFEPWTSGL